MTSLEALKAALAETLENDDETSHGEAQATAEDTLGKFLGEHVQIIAVDPFPKAKKD